MRRGTEDKKINCIPRQEVMVAPPPRARGDVALRVKSAPGGTALSGLRMAGSLKALFPRARRGLEALLVNTAGGITGGDRFSIVAEAGPGSDLTLTSQAAERVYRSSSGAGRVDTVLRAGPGARLSWLPQELIFFDGGALRRSLHVDLSSDARLLMVEPIVFGRQAMGETISTGQFSDRIRIDCAGVPLYRDALQIDQDFARVFARRAGLNGSIALASVVCVGPEVDGHLKRLREMLPATGGVSLPGPNVLCVRIVAADGFELRRSLVPVLEHLHEGALPISWRL
jgi:urease accessory protein